VLTISAAYGAGGSVVGPQLATRLGLPFADRLIPSRGSASPGEQLSDDERDQIRRRSFFARLGHVTGGLGLPVPETPDVGGAIRRQVEASLADLAAEDSPGAVILGRGAAVVLGRHPRAFHVRLDGPADRRCRQAMAIEDIDAATAKDRQTETDGARARYLARLYDRDPADPTLYHLVLDSTAVPLPRCVELVELAADAFWRAAA
jgi:hypothetical protein